MLGVLFPRVREELRLAGQKGEDGHIFPQNIPSNFDCPRVMQYRHAFKKPSRLAGRFFRELFLFNECLPRLGWLIGSIGLQAEDDLCQLTAGDGAV